MQEKEVNLSQFLIGTVLLGGKALINAFTPEKVSIPHRYGTTEETNGLVEERGLDGLNSS